MTDRIPMEVLPSAEAVAQRAAEFIAADARKSVAARDQFLLATSGGTTPWRMLQLLTTCAVPWAKLHLFQVDERIVEASDPSRNLNRLQLNLLTKVRIPDKQVHPMPVEATDLQLAAEEYAHSLQKIAGTLPQLDLIHLGLGADGHTASLVPGDSALDSTSQVAISGTYQGLRRMTLTFTVINQARRVLWVVTGSEKTAALSKLLAGDLSIPATRVSTQRALLLVDEAAAQRL